MRNWIPNLDAYPGPAYLAVVSALEEAIRRGIFAAGDTLPSQRILADFLGLHVNIVNRAMRESARRGLTSGNTRRGTLILPQRRWGPERDQNPLSLMSRCGTR
ncbi:GntR family transcriptional regulator [Paraburkholderia madseniana]|uniref:GntR family transcriptional regulator n=1 Tax=Paraburkholderia madseniana TaxID=2599607 RepID=A0A6N6VYV2_9BURK|nr:GntR family transcriptional regulator [Paraburkholderia madseniana]KAE8753426.1 GntR family transcriptional regulator [Paraburkholderia madseniana]